MVGKPKNPRYCSTYVERVPSRDHESISNQPSKGRCLTAWQGLKFVMDYGRYIMDMAENDTKIMAKYVEYNGREIDLRNIDY